MFENVLVGVDFRPSGRDAIALASALRDPEASMALLHAYAGRTVPAHAVTSSAVVDERAHAERQLRRERAESGVEAELIVRQGATAGRVLHEEAEARGADLIVVGSCHRGALGRAVLGDDTRAALNGAPCAVAIAPHGFALRDRPIAAIGVAYDGSPESQRALEAARTLAAARHAEVRALHVVSLPAYQWAPYGPLAISRIGELVERADEQMSALEGVDGHAEYGVPGAELAVFAGEVDLLVAGSRGYGPWGRLVHGSTTARLARSAQGPLLILPRASRRPPAEGADRDLEAQRPVPA